MEIVAKVCLGILGLVVAILVAGFASTWWELHQREKAKRGKQVKKDGESWR